MEKDVDGSIIETCKLLECTFANEEDIEFDNTQIFEFFVKCIWRIDGETENRLPSYVFPRHITERLKQATIISKILESWKIYGDISFHNILYGSINTLRQVFVELIKKIPREFDAIEIEERPNELIEIARNALKSESDLVPFICRNSTYEPEIFHINSNCQSYDPRTWISTIFEDFSPSSSLKPLKPSIPFKPKSLFKSTVSNLEVLENTNSDPQVEEYRLKLKEVSDLELKYQEKFEEYENSQKELAKLQESNDNLRNNIGKYDPMYIEILQDIEGNGEILMNKILSLNERMEKDAQQGLEHKSKLNEELEEIRKECLEKGVATRSLSEIIDETEKLKEQIEIDEILIEKLKKKIEKNGAHNKFSLLEKRCTDVENMIEKQEKYMKNIIEELQEVEKKQEREYDIIDRSFTIILNTLIRSSETNRVRKHIQAFLNIHMISSDIVECIKKSSKLKLDTEKLYEEITVEERKDYDKQRRLIENDITEIENENAQLIDKIRKMDPNFNLDSVLH